MFYTDAICDKAKTEFAKRFADWIEDLLLREKEVAGFRMEHSAIEARMNESEMLMDCVESPIEQIIGSRLLFSTDGYNDLVFLQDHDPVLFPNWGTAFTPQTTFKEYRCDFMITSSCDGFRRSIVIECDGHAFHERTKEQAKRDKARDRSFTLAGISVLRFTGSEIYNNPDDCANQIEFAVNNAIEDAMADVGELPRRRQA